MLDKLSHTFAALWQSLLSFIKVILLSRFFLHKPKCSKEELSRGIVVLGNGPSLNDTIANAGKFLSNHNLLAVNFAACADVFTTLRPRYYLLADPHFFKATDQPNVNKMWQRLSMVDWDMTLFVPARMNTSTDHLTSLAGNRHISITRYNTTPVEGLKTVENMLFSSGLGMPRPRNVLIPSIMMALQMGYKKIYVAGADHSWMKTLSVDDNNNVVSIQPHFYKEDDKEVQRVKTEYMHYPLHTIIYSFYVAFKSYFTIARYAKHIGASIINITPGSFIDAFPRENVHD